MTATTIIALWAALVSTAVAVTQLTTFRNSRPRLSVRLSHSEFPGHDGPEAAFGAKTRSAHGPDILDVTVVPFVSVSNSGDRAVQLASITVEEFNEALGRLNIQEIVPDALPTVLEARSSVELPVQIEFFDNFDSITFVGITDALGNRHAVEGNLAAEIEYLWQLPTEVVWYRRKDDPDYRVRAFQAKQKGRLSQATPKKSSRVKVIVSRPHPEPPPSTPKPIETVTDAREET